MGIRVEFRHRAEQGTPVLERHSLVVGRMGRVIRQWFASFDPRSVYFETDAQQGGAADFSPALPAAVAAAVSYCSRTVIDNDHGMYDDVFTLEFEEAQVEYSTFARSVFRQIVEAFEAYRGSVVLDEDLDLDDFAAIVEAAEASGVDPDGRDGVYRIAPVSFFDRELCRRSFALTPEQIISRVHLDAEIAEILNGGVLLVVTSALLKREDLISLDERIRVLLRGA